MLTADATSAISCCNHFTVNDPFDSVTYYRRGCEKFTPAVVAARPQDPRAQDLFRLTNLGVGARVDFPSRNVVSTDLARNRAGAGYRWRAKTTSKASGCDL